MTDDIIKWMREVAGLAPEAVVEVRDEAHCPDPGCPLRRTVIGWTVSPGQSHRIVVVKPVAYVRREDIERAVRVVRTGGS
jgi:hypothetical protein